MDQNTTTHAGGVLGNIKHKWLGGAVVLVLVLLSAFLFMKTLSEIRAYHFIGGGVPVTNTVSVQGTGEVFAVPDIATFSFSVIEERATVSEAQAAAAERINSAISFLEESGIEETDIRTTSFNLYPRYEFPRVVCPQFGPCPGGERMLAGFEVTQSVAVKVRDTAKAGDLLGGIGEIGVQNVSGLNFTIDDEDALKAEARGKAIEDAEAKARQLADDLGVRVVRVVSFNENNHGVPYFARSTMDFAVEESVAGFGGAEMAAPKLPAGENKIVSSVFVTYEIR